MIYMENEFEGNPLRWKHGHASYNYHTPLEYEIIEKGEHGDWRHPHSQVHIRPFTIGPAKSKFHNVLFRKTGLKELHLPDYTFWIPRRMMRRGPYSWSIKKDRWVHKKTFDECLARAYLGREDYSPAWGWW